MASVLPNALSDAVINVKVNGVTTRALIDSGSSDSFINYCTVRKLGIKITQHDKQSICMAAKTCVSETVGSVYVDLEVVGHKHNGIRLQVLDNLCCDIIVGHDILNKHDKLVINFGGQNSSFVVDNISHSGFACALTPVIFNPPPLFEHLARDVHPIACKSRRFSPDDQQFIDNEVGHLLSEGIIEASTSPWRAQVLVTSNERHKRRMVIDYSRTINRYTTLDAYPLPNMDVLANKVAQYSIFSTFDLKSAYHQVPICDSDKPYTAFEASGRLYQFTRIPFGVTNGGAAFQRIMDSIIDQKGLHGIFAYLDNITVCGVDQDDHDNNVRKFMEAVQSYNLTLNHDKSIISVREINLLGFLISKGEIKPDPDRMQPLNDLPVPHDRPSLKRALGLFSYYSQWVPKYSDKIQPLTGDPVFPLSQEAIKAFESVKQCIASSSVVCPNKTDPLVLESDASGYALSASLNQGGKPVAFFSRTLKPHEKHHSSVEKEACAVVEACRKWRHYLSGRRFLIVTDQEAVSYMFNTSISRGKVKNEKILRWRIELSCLDFDVKYRPGKENVTADCLTRAYCSALSHPDALKELHIGLCHPGIVRLNHYVRNNNLPYSMEDVKRVISQCTTCAELKPNFFKPQNPPLIKASRPFERISMDFKGPLPSETRNKYLLTIVDEHSRFPFAFPCSDLLATTVKRCLIELFSVFGESNYVHSDRGRQFISENLKSFLLAYGIGSSHSASYNPRGNGQCERYNGIIWKSIQLALKSKGLKQTQWESVLPEALHSIRSLLCTATNETPHDRLFGFPRRNSAGNSLPSWLLERGKVLLRRHVRKSKYDDLCDVVDLIDTNPTYARVRLDNGYEKTVSLRDLAPLPKSDEVISERINTPLISESPVAIQPVISPSGPPATCDTNVPQPTLSHDPMASDQPPTQSSVQPSAPLQRADAGNHGMRRLSQRQTSVPDRLSYDRKGGPKETRN